MLRVCKVRRLCVLTRCCLISLLLGYGMFSFAEDVLSLEDIVQLTTRNQWRSAAPQIARYRRSHPDSVEAAILQADILIHMGLLADAGDLIQRELAIHPRSIEALTAYAKLSESLHQNALAEKFLVRCTKYAPQDPDTWQRLGDFYLASGRKEALAAFQQVLQLSPRTARAMSGIAAFHHQEADDVSALRDFKQAEAWDMAGHSPDATVYLRFGDFLSAKQEYRESLERYQRALKVNSTLAEARLGCARDHVHLEQWEAAEMDLKITAADEGSEIESLNLLVKVYQAEGKKPEAQDAASRAEHLSEQLNNEKAKRNQIADALQNARALQEQKRFDQAAVAYQQLVDRQPDAQAGWMHLGECYAALKRTTDAESAFQLALRLAPDSPQTRIQLGKVLLQEQKTQGAREEFTQALEIDPLLSDAQVGIAASFMYEHNYKDAIGALEKAKSIPGVGIDPRLMLTEAFFKSGQRELAIREIDDAIKKFPEDKQALAMRESLRIAQH